MQLIDTHSHIYVEEFAADYKKVIENAVNEGVIKILMPNVDSATINPMLKFTADFPGFCYPMIGIHPTSVKSDTYKSELSIFELQLQNPIYIGIGEIGIDLYWDKTHLKEQKYIFEYQLDAAIKRNKPVVIHVRDSFQEVYQSVLKYKDKNLKGIFHCFSGDYGEAKKIIDLGFYLGIGGVVTFKNSKLRDILANVPLQHIVTETDCPWLAPVPFRGQRNECSYIKYVVNELSKIYNTNNEDIAEITTNNALRLFSLND